MRMKENSIVVVLTIRAVEMTNDLENHHQTMMTFHNSGRKEDVFNYFYLFFFYSIIVFLYFNLPPPTNKI